MGGRSDGLGGNVKLGVIGIAVKVETVVAYDVSKGKHVEDEEEGAKHRTLGNTLGDWGCVGLGFVYADELVAVGEVRFEPGKGGASDVKGGF